MPETAGSSLSRWISARDLVVRRIRRQPMVEAADADFGAGPLLAAHIHSGRRVVAHEHRGEPGRLVSLRHPRGHGGPDLGAHLLRDRLAVYERC